MSLTLSHIEQILPVRWREFVPSPKHGYIEHVHSGLVTLGVVAPGDRRFHGFSNVPRYFHPYAQDEALALTLELICWYFYFDDPFDEGVVTASRMPRLVERMLEVLEHGELSAGATPTERLCRQFRQRAILLSGGRSRVCERFLGRCCDWVRSIMPISRHEHDTMPDLPEYDRLRLLNVGILPEIVLNEIIGDLSLDETFLEMPEVRRLGELTALVTAYCNDIYSYEREAKHQTQLNSLELRRLHGKLTLEEAFTDQIAHIRSMIDQFLALESSLATLGLVGWSTSADTVETARQRRQQTHYVEGMKTIVVGNHYWSLADGRYCSHTSPFPELRRAPGTRAGHLTTIGSSRSSTRVRSIAG